MKRIRILTGANAGAQVKLTPGKYRIGSDNDSDIRVSDWQGHDLLLTVDPEWIVTAQRIGPDALLTTAADALKAGASVVDPGCVFLIELVPMRFGDTVLCIGWEDAVWPSDLDLLSSLLTRTENPGEQGNRKRRLNLIGIGLACGALIAVITIASTLMTTQASEAAAPHDASDLARRINQLLTTANQRGLQAQAVGSVVRITGMVATSADDLAVRKRIALLGAASIERQYDVAENDARSIEESLGIPDLHVAYVGDGVFDVTGKVSNSAPAIAAISRVRVDLDENVKDLRNQLTEITNNNAPIFSELLLSNAVQYAETPDGVKHIYASDGTAFPEHRAVVAPASGQAVPLPQK